MTTRTSQDRNRPSSRLDSEGEEDDDDADKVSTECSDCHYSPKMYPHVGLRVHNILFMQVNLMCLNALNLDCVCYMLAI